MQAFLLDLVILTGAASGFFSADMFRRDLFLAAKASETLLGAPLPLLEGAFLETDAAAVATTGSSSAAAATDADDGSSGAASSSLSWPD